MTPRPHNILRFFLHIAKVLETHKCCLWEGHRNSHVEMKCPEWEFARQKKKSPWASPLGQIEWGERFIFVSVILEIDLVGRRQML